MTENQKASVRMLNLMMDQAAKIEPGPIEILPFLIAIGPGGHTYLLMPSTLPDQVRPARVIFNDGTEVEADEWENTHSSHQVGDRPVIEKPYRGESPILRDWARRQCEEAAMDAERKPKVEPVAEALAEELLDSFLETLQFLTMTDIKELSNLHIDLRAIASRRD